MSKFNRWIVSGCLGLGLLLGSGPVVAGADRGYKHHEDGYSELRDVVDRTQNDLRAAADLEPRRNDDHNRYKNAQGHLSTFDRKLVKGKFDKDELGKALGDIKDILDHNVLQGSSRDNLMRDVTDLKIARDRRE